VEQTIRHSYIVSLLCIKHVVVCINKMDMVSYNETVYSAIIEKYKVLAQQLKLSDVTYIPVSALKGDNIVQNSGNMDWYEGESLLHFLEKVDTDSLDKSQLARMPVQWVVRPQTEELHDYRGYAGRVLSGTFNLNDKVTVLPGGASSTVEKIDFFDQTLDAAHAGQSVIIHLKDDVDISRGDTIVNASALPQETKLIEADLCWMDTRALDTSIMYNIQHNSKITKCKISEILHKVDINSLEKHAAEEFKLNDIGRVIVRTADALAFDLYDDNRANGSAILVDTRTNLTVGALMFRAAVE
jgi:sulfate adenylyltransferase subunit 1